MKEQIYTIPINEAFDKYQDCPLCEMYNNAVTRAVEYITGSAMMEPDIRRETNKKGFCYEHYQKLLSVRNRLSLGLTVETHLIDVDKICFEDVKTPFLQKYDAEKVAKTFEEMTESCFVCDQVEYYMEKYYQNIIYLWKNEPEFQKKYKEQKYFCFPHLAKLIAASRKTLNKKTEMPEFINQTLDVTRNCLSAVSTDVSKFTKSFDHRYNDIKMTDDIRKSIERAIFILSGRKM